MAARSVTIEASGAVSAIRLQREPVNALDAGTLEELGAAADAAGAETGGRLVVIASAIDGVFCSGGDLKFWRTFPKEQAHEVSRAGREAFARIAWLEKATIAVIDGHVIGDGLALALSCDLRVASSRATFRLPEAGYGFIPGWGTLHHLVRTIGQPRTLDMILTGRSVEAATALEWGLVSRVEPVDTFASGLRGLLDTLLGMSPTALALAKAALRSAWGGSDLAPERELAAFTQAWGGQDCQEGIAALFARRSPRFAAREESPSCPARDPASLSGGGHVR